MTNSGRKSVLALLDRLGTAERGFLDTEFLAPIVRGGEVQVQIAAVRCRLRVEPAAFEGWGIFRPASYTMARLERSASMAERRRYLALFPAVAMVLVRPQGSAWLAVPANLGDDRFHTGLRVEGLVPVRLVEEPDRFDTIRARFDGSQFWFDEADPRSDPGVAGYLRQALAAMTDPAALSRPGLTAGQRNAYATEHRLRRDEEAERFRREADRARRRLERDRREQLRTGEGRVRAALAHAGADLLDLAERGDVYRVTYAVDGGRHTSVVRKHDLGVQTAGICLSGQDRHFDLHSLVGVIREGERGGIVVPTL